MSSISEVFAPQSNVNDTSLVVCEYLVENKSFVSAGQDIIGIETSKTTANVKSPCDGYIKFIVSIGDEVPNDKSLAIIAANIEELDIYVEAGDNNAREKKQVVSAGFTKFGFFDYPVSLGEIMVKNGTKVIEGDVICKVRNANSIETVKAPRTGYAFWKKEPYKSIMPGDYAGIIAESQNDAAVLLIDADTDSNNYESVRVSKSAQSLLDEKGLEASDLGLSGLVTLYDVQARLNKSISNSGTKEDKKETEKTYHNTTGNYIQLSMSKRSEATYLSIANKDAVVSQSSVLVPTKGIFTACLEDSELARRFSAILIFEVSRLLQKYPLLTSVYDSNGLFVYDSINVGYALSIDDGLKVPVFKNSDKKDIDAILAEKDGFIERYINRELTIDDLSGGSFTITDLSSTGCFSFNPVINLGQSSILGIGGENTLVNEYSLVLAYDHRAVDGAMATDFLCELRERLIAHENVLLGTETPEPYCDNCLRSLSDLEEKGNYLIKAVNRHGEEKCICSLCVGGL